MFYRKNLGTTARLARFVGGLVAGAGALVLLGLTPTGIAVAASGAMAAMSGLMGFCPACAMYRRGSTPERP